MGFSLSSSEVAGSIAALTPTRSTLRAALCAGYTAVPTAQNCPRDSVFTRCEAIIAEPFAERIIPASPSLGFLGGLFRFEEVREQRPDLPLLMEPTIKIPVAECLQKMIRGYGFTSGRIGDCAGDLQDVIVGTGPQSTRQRRERATAVVAGCACDGPIRQSPV